MLSGMLHELSLEPLLCKIHASITGLVLRGFSKNIVLSGYADDVIVMAQNQDVNILVNLRDSFNVLSSARVKWRKSKGLAVGQWCDGLPVLSPEHGLEERWFKVFLGNKSIAKKKLGGDPARTEGKLKKCRWLFPHMSFRGRVLVINNLIASMLWYKLACLEPTPGLLE